MHQSANVISSLADSGLGHIVSGRKGFQKLHSRTFVCSMITNVCETHVLFRKMFRESRSCMIVRHQPGEPGSFCSLAFNRLAPFLARTIGDWTASRP